MKQQIRNTVAFIIVLALFSTGVQADAGRTANAAALAHQDLAGDVSTQTGQEVSQQVFANLLASMKAEGHELAARLRAEASVALTQARLVVELPRNEMTPMRTARQAELASAEVK